MLIALSIERYSQICTTAYRFGFNGQEKDDEVKGNGNSLDFGARILDPRIGKWLSLDAKAHVYPMLSDYAFVGNNPIAYIDPDGNKISFGGNIKAQNLFLKIYANANDEDQAAFDKLIDSDVIYNILLNAPTGPSPGGSTKIDFETGEINILVDDIGDQSVEILGDELAHAHQYEVGDIGFVQEEAGAEPVVTGYDINDEIASKESAIRAAESTNTPLIAGGSGASYKESVMGKGMDPKKWVKKFSNKNGSYRAIFKSLGQEGMKGSIPGYVLGEYGSNFQVQEGLQSGIIQKFSYRRPNREQNGEIKHKTITEETGTAPR